MGLPLEPTPARLAWSRNHPDADALADRISNLAAIEPGDDDPGAIATINAALATVRGRVDELAARYKLAGLDAVRPEFDPATQTLPMAYWPWPQVGLVVAMWRECNDPMRRVELAEAARDAAYDAARRTPTGKLNGEPFPSD